MNAHKGWLPQNKGWLTITSITECSKVICRPYAAHFEHKKLPCIRARAEEALGEY